jgi:hypothetical protein
MLPQNSLTFAPVTSVLSLNLNVMYAVWNLLGTLERMEHFIFDGNSKV